ncbi:ECF-type riboflavin transporter substrate-binding protein [Streptococcus caprae]|uniref:UPF0397 protein ACFORF_06430 n=1 Tax=Streptococcus caprae TaxID=1640501 RepID=A0ABV8CVN9_9STRE
MKNNSTKNVVAIGIGAALFILIGMINIPIFGNTSIQLQYAVQALFSVIFGPVVGFFMGFIGHALKDAIQYGGVAWAWVLASGLVGLGIGAFRRFYDATKGSLSAKELVFFNFVQIVTLFVAHGLVCPMGDRIQYAQEWSYLFTQGVVAATSNAITIGVAGTILLVVYARTRTQSGSLTKN